MSKGEYHAGEDGGESSAAGELLEARSMARGRFALRCLPVVLVFLLFLVALQAEVDEALD